MANYISNFTGEEVDELLKPATINKRGTVKGSNSVTIGADGSINVSVFESGSNSNGNYIKFADGTMICWRSHLSLKSGYIEAFGGGNIYSLSQTLYPQTFVGNLVANVTICAGAYGCWLYGVDTWNDKLNISVFRPGGAVGDFNAYVSYMAIGRWK